ncbi:MAG: hypothetical protein LUG89_04395 [Methanosphaera sp.]|nr:hypothetical protein [Methanosphaera sp.]
MNKRLILSILIVALIGVLVATHQINTENLLDPFVSVDTEEDSVTSALAVPASEGDNQAGQSESTDNSAQEVADTSQQTTQDTSSQDTSSQDTSSQDTGSQDTSSQDTSSSSSSGNALINSNNPVSTASSSGSASADSSSSGDSDSSASTGSSSSGDSDSSASTDSSSSGADSSSDTSDNTADSDSTDTDSTSGELISARQAYNYLISNGYYSNFDINADSVGTLDRADTTYYVFEATNADGNTFHIMVPQDIENYNPYVYEDYYDGELPF